MTPAARTVYFVALALGLTVGIAFGFWNRASLLKIADEDFVDPTTLEEFSYAQYKYASPEHAKAALDTSVRLLEEMEEFHPAKDQEIRLAMIYTRLALLTEASNAAQSKTFITTARHWRVTSGYPDLSDAEMKSWLLAFDRFRPTFR